jgi:hypothetical protein
MPDSFVELDLDLFQTEKLKRVVEAAKKNRKGTIFVSVAPDVPNPFWRLQACSLGEKATDRIRKIIKEELGENP